MGDEVTYEKIIKLIDQLTTTGKDELEKNLLRELFLVCSKSEELIKFCNEQLFEQLSKKHAEIKFGVFLVINEFFMRSNYYRDIFIQNDLNNYLELTIFQVLKPPNPKKPLKPLKVAQKLKERVIEALNRWDDKFGHEFISLNTTCNFINQSLLIPALNQSQEDETTARNRLSKENERNILISKLKALKDDVDSRYNQIQETVTELQTCLGILVPQFPDDESDSEASENDEDNDGWIYKPKVSIKINNDNQDLIRKLNESYKLCKRKYIPLILRWTSTVGSDDKILLQHIKNLQKSVAKELRNYERLKFTGNVDELSDNANDTDSEFEDVPGQEDDREEYLKLPIFNPTNSKDEKEKPNDPIPSSSSNCKLNSTSAFRKPTKPSLTSSISIDNVSFFSEVENNPEDPTTYAATLKRSTNEIPLPGPSKKRPMTSEQIKNMNPRKRKLLEMAPKVPFSVDLYHWEDDKLVAPTIVLPESDSHRFWQPTDREGEEVPVPGGLESIRTRRIEFTGDFEPVKWSCRTPLPSGKLCPRKDRNKCPLHGIVIARDESGNPTNPDDILRLEAKKLEEEKNKPPDWQDPKFLEELKAKIGIDLTIKKPKKGKKKFTEQYPGLTDIDKRLSTPKERLAKKIFSKKARDRVAKSLDTLDEKRFKDKYGDQFNYAMFEND